MRVLHLTERLDFAGAGANLPLYLKFANHDLFDMTMGSFFEADANRKGILESQGIRTHEFYGEAELLERYLREQEIDILHISGGELPGGHLRSFAEIANRRSTKAIIHLNFFAHGNGDGLDLTLLQNKTMAWKYMRNNDISSDDFWEHCGILPVGIDIERIHSLKPSEREVLELKDRLGIGDSPTICRLGRPDPFKWSYFLLYAFSRLLEKVPNARLLVVGGTPPSIERKIKTMGLSSKIIDVGEVSDDEVIKILHSIDILAHSSRIGESFTATIPQAMACRKPVVVNSTPWADNGQVEQVDSWVDGLITTTVDQYADACAKLLKDPYMRKRMGDNGHFKVRLLYDARTVTRLLEKFYAQAMTKTVKTPSDAGELSNWPARYDLLLRQSGYQMNGISGKLLHYLWKSALLFPSIRERLPADGILASVA